MIPCQNIGAVGVDTLSPTIFKYFPKSFIPDVRDYHPKNLMPKYHLPSHPHLFLIGDYVATEKISP